MLACVFVRSWLLLNQGRRSGLPAEEEMEELAEEEENGSAFDREWVLLSNHQAYSRADGSLAQQALLQAPVVAGFSCCWSCSCNDSSWLPLALLQGTRHSHMFGWFAFQHA